MRLTYEPRLVDRSRRGMRGLALGSGHLEFDIALLGVVVDDVERLPVG
jgi:hypothetical protein